MLHLGAVHALNAAAGVTDNHYLLDAKFIDRHEKAAHRAVKRICYRAACVLNDFHVAVTEAEGCRKQLDKARVHTGHDCDALVGIFVCAKAFVALFSHKTPIMFKYFVNHCFINFLLLSDYCHAVAKKEESNSIIINLLNK